MNVRERSISAPSREVCGFRSFAFQSIEELVEHVNAPAMLVALNAEKVARGDEPLKRIVNDNIGYADGMGVVLALRRKGLRCHRISGADLWRPLLRSRPSGSRLFLVGSTMPIVARAAARMRSEFPDVVVAGFHDGYLQESDARQLEADLLAAKPDVVLVAMGSPRQELLMDHLIGTWPAIYMGLGGAFDVYVGKRRRAPQWMQRAGLEWLFRFAADPRRLPRLGAYVRFAWLLAIGRT